MISLIHPSRSRPELAQRTASSWIQNAGCDVEYILSLDSDDAHNYHDMAMWGYDLIVNDNKSAIQAINKAAIVSTGDVIVVMSDDFLCFPNWGKKIQQLMSGKADWILKTNDWKYNTQEAIQNWIITLPIMDRIYYERFGYIYNEEYRHQWCDTEMTIVAEMTGCKVVSDLGFIHLNDGSTKIVDDLSTRNDNTFEHGRRIFTERKRRNFDLAPADIIGKVTDNYYTNIR